MENRIEEKLPQIVEDRLQEAYGMIRKGEVKQMKKKRYLYKWAGTAAVCAVIITASAGVLAAAAYFQKEAHQEADRITYEFHINYDLVPGEYQVEPGYLPEGYQDQGGGKYYGEDGLGITVMPIYTTTELDKTDGKIDIANIEHVEHTTLSGMEADIITFQEAKKYQTPTYIFLFNEAEGYVLEIVGQYTVGTEELLKFADNLTVKRTGDGAYETEEERLKREQEKASAEEQALKGQKTRDALQEAGIPEDKIYNIGEELKAYDESLGYTVMKAEFLEGIAGFNQKDFFDFSRFDGWLNEDGTLKPYTRLHYDENMELLGEERTDQEVLRVDMKVHCYNSSIFEEVPLDFSLQYVEKRADGSCTWALDEYASVPEENYSLQIDNSAVYLNGSVHTEGEDRKAYFFRQMKEGEEFFYTLLFVVDQDRKEDFLLQPVSGNYSLNQIEDETVSQIRDQLDGYIRLK